MKHVSLCSMVLCLLLACSTPETKSKETATADDKSTPAPAAPVTYAYTPTYSADWEIGDSKYAQTVLELWKDFDNNSFDNHKDVFADSVYIEFSDGSHFSGTRDSLVATMKGYRTSLGTSTSYPIAWTALRSKDKNETWVCIWGKEVDEKNGKKDSVNLNENWLFNKDGKISFMTQYDQKYKAGK
jgi:hypothetical protein